MGLTIKDFIATTLVLVTGWIWYAQSSGPLKSFNARWIMLSMLIVGIVMCAQGSLGSTSASNPWIIVASVLGGLSFLVALWGLITGAKITLTIFAGMVAMLWLITTVRHLFKL